MKEGQQILGFYQVLQRELLDPKNGNQIQRYASRRLTPTRTTNVNGRPRDAEHCASGAGYRHLSKTSAETAES